MRRRPATATLFATGLFWLALAVWARPDPVATVVQLRAELVTQKDRLLLGEVAEITCPDPGQHAKLAGFDLGYAPQPGQGRTLYRADLLRQLRREFGAALAVTGADVVRVTRAAATMAPRWRSSRTTPCSNGRRPP